MNTHEHARLTHLRRLERVRDITNLLAFNVYATSFALHGFNEVRLTSAVPEPERWTLLPAGLAGVGSLACRRRLA